jgi:hypothetical protein
MTHPPSGPPGQRYTVLGSNGHTKIQGKGGVGQDSVLPLTQQCCGILYWVLLPNTANGHPIQKKGREGGVTTEQP